MRSKHSCQWARKYFIYPTQKWPLQTFSGTITQLGAETGLGTGLSSVVYCEILRTLGLASALTLTAISQSHT